VKYALALVALALFAGCGGIDERSAARELLAVRPAGSSGPLVAYDVSRGREAFRLPAGVRSADGARFVTGRADGPRTTITVYDAGAGRRLDDFSIRGRWRLGGVSPAARWLALSRASGPDTRLAVVDASRHAVTARASLRGDFDVDAVGAGGRDLFLIQHLPGFAHTAYSVWLYDVETRRLSEPSALGDDDEEPMAGYAWSGVASPDGGWLLTLYLNTTRNLAFVHALNLKTRHPACIDLPSGSGDLGRLERYSLALAPDGRTLLAANAALGIVATVDLAKLRVVRTDTLTGSSPGGPRSASAVSHDGRTLAYASGRDLWLYDLGSRRVRGPFRAGAPLLGVGFARDGRTVGARADGRLVSFAA
jgi:hypothetical protein